MELVPPILAGGFLTTEPPGKCLIFYLVSFLSVSELSREAIEVFPGAKGLDLLCV